MFIAHYKAHLANFCYTYLRRSSFLEQIFAYTLLFAFHSYANSSQVVVALSSCYYVFSLPSVWPNSGDFANVTFKSMGNPKQETVCARILNPGQNVFASNFHFSHPLSFAVLVKIGGPYHGAQPGRPRQASSLHRDGRQANRMKQKTSSERSWEQPKTVWAGTAAGSCGLSIALWWSSIASRSFRLSPFC